MTRKRFARVSETFGNLTRVFLHPRALVETREVGEGSRVWANAHIMHGAEVGKHCNVCDGVFIESGVKVGDEVTIKNGVTLWEGITIEDKVFVGPNVTFANDPAPRTWILLPSEEFARTTIREGATLQAGSSVGPGLTVGAYAMVKQGAVVESDVPDHALVAGFPAERVGWVCECGKTLGEDLKCVCGKAWAEGDNGLKAA